MNLYGQPIYDLGQFGFGPPRGSSDQSSSGSCSEGEESSKSAQINMRENNGSKDDCCAHNQEYD